MLSIGKPRMIVFKGPSASKKILKVLYEHFQGGTSLGVFFNRSYHCYECDREFNAEDYDNHLCERRKCVSCHRMNSLK